MPQKSRWSVPIPEISVPSYLFGSPSAALPDRTAFADADRPEALFLTWAGFRLWSQRLAAGLRAAGLASDDRVVVFVPNHVLFPVLFMGVVMAGGVFSSANARGTALELAYQLKVAKPRFLIASRGSLGVALEAAEMAGLGKERIWAFDGASLEEGGLGRAEDEVQGIAHWKALLADEEAGRAFAWEEMRGPEAKMRDLCLPFSSGTTGLPKGVRITHFQLVANAVQTNLVMNLNPDVATPALSAQNSRWLCCLPLYHGLALCYFATISVSRRVTTYIMQHFSLDRMLDHIQRFRITELHLVPPIIVSMARHAGVAAGRYDLSSVTGGAFSCAAPLGAGPTRRFEALWPRGVMCVRQGLAQTESACNTLGWDPRLAAVPGSVGEPMPNCEIKLVDDAGREVARGERGEICVRSPNVARGYWRNAAATAETFTPGGWLKTGDVACVDDKGYYHIVDRKKEMIKVKGVSVAPAELESVLLDHPGVQDAAVIGVRRDDDEFPRAYIVPKPDANLSTHDISQFMSSRVSSIKRLAGGIVFVDSIPKTPSGKILRKVLRAAAAKESKI